MQEKYGFETPGNILGRTLQGWKLEKIMADNGFTEVDGFHNSGYYPFLDRWIGNCRQFRSPDGLTVSYYPKNDLGSGDYERGLSIIVTAENGQKADEKHDSIVGIIAKFAEEKKKITETLFMDLLLG